MSVDASSPPDASRAGDADRAFAQDLLQPDIPLKDWNTFGFDVRARFGATVDSAEALRAVLRDTRVAGLPVHVLGGGSNIVLTGDLDALVLRIALRGRSIVSASDVVDDGRRVRVQAGAGEPWHAFVDWTLAQGCPGLENLALIPGTVGAAPVQNIGAYGVEIADFFDTLTAMDRQTGDIRRFDCADCRFGYRDSVFKQPGGERWIILSVTFSLPKQWAPRRAYADLDKVLQARQCTAPTPRDIFDAVVAVRQAKLPDPAVIGNAGSFFKNPVIDAAQWASLQAREPGLIAYPQTDGRYKLAAGWLIDQCGWKGRGIAAGSAARVHDRQALVLTNTGGATGHDVMQLAACIVDDVAARFGVRLEAEPLVL
ncbi:UDP-N-acetylmuramate dehydrogenase [Robbsia sp. KACC 23696]|uniref:UDP-N-acetylmuramate dehydrogenase n=1 Tax=Robbsia sp. KACC 23696 TaxID=3149231 RepID=UPI00325B8430